MMIDDVGSVLSAGLVHSAHYSARLSVSFGAAGGLHLSGLMMITTGLVSPVSSSLFRLARSTDRMCWNTKEGHNCLFSSFCPIKDKF